MKLSIIVPIYNVAPYLRKCVDSLLAQDYEDYEIILVDDGSTDGSSDIADAIQSEFSERHTGYCLVNAAKPLLIDKEQTHTTPKIKVIHQENAGLSAARNTGIAAAQGEYVCFVDSDDYWEENVLGALMAQVDREKLDVLRFDYHNVRQKANGEYEVFQPNKYPHAVDLRCDIVNGETYLNERMGYACYAVQFILRRELSLQEQFTTGIHFEDVDWMPRMLLKAERVNSTSLVVYNYLVRLGSITKVQGDVAKMRINIEDSIYVIRTLFSLKKQYPHNYWLQNMISLSAASVLTYVANYLYNERDKYIRLLQDMKVFPLIIADQGKTYIRRAKMINCLGMNIYCKLIHGYKFIRS